MFEAKYLAKVKENYMTKQWNSSPKSVKICLKMMPQNYPTLKLKIKFFLLASYFIYSEDKNFQTNDGSDQFILLKNDICRIEKLYDMIYNFFHPVRGI